jgi:hypothetical protein
MDRKARTGDTVLVKSREIGAKHCRGGWGEVGKDDRKHNTLAPLHRTKGSIVTRPHSSMDIELKIKMEGA